MENSSEGGVGSKATATAVGCPSQTVSSIANGEHRDYRSCYSQWLATPKSVKAALEESCAAEKVIDPNGFSGHRACTNLVTH